MEAFVDFVTNVDRKIILCDARKANSFSETMQRRLVDILSRYGSRAVPTRTAASVGTAPVQVSAICCYITDEQ